MKKIISAALITAAALALNGSEPGFRITNFSYSVFRADYSHGTNAYIQPRFTNSGILYQTNAPRAYTITTTNFPRLGEKIAILAKNGIPENWITNPHLSRADRMTFFHADSNFTNWLLSVTAIDTNWQVVRAETVQLNLEPFELFWLNGYASNSLREVHRVSQSNLLSSATKGASNLQYWSTIDPAAFRYERNSDCILSNLDTTGISPMRISGGVGYQGYSVAIGRRYISGAAHIGWFPGMEVAFFDATNGIVRRTIVTNHTLAQDLMIGVLDSDLPDSIRHFKVWPNLNFWALFPYVQDFGGIAWKGTAVPCFGINKFGTVFAQEHHQTTDLVNQFFHPHQARPSFWYPEIGYSAAGGDSSTPVFSLLGTNVIYWGGWFFPWRFPIAGAGNTDQIVAAVGTNFLDPVNLDSLAFPETTSHEISGGQTDPFLDPGVSSMIYVNRSNGSVFHWNSTTTNWIKIIGP